MGLQLDYTDPNGITIPNTYLVIDEASYRKRDGVISCSAGYYKNKEAVGVLPCISRYTFSFPIDFTTTDNLIAEAYKQLKNIAGFTAAVDV